MTPTTLLTLSSAICLSFLAINRNHLLMSLLTLEMFMLTITMLTPMTVASYNQINAMLPILFLTMGACEASLGLSILVSMIRSTGNDLLKTINKTLC